MNNQFIKSFTPLTTSEEIKIFHVIRKNEVQPVAIHEEYINKYLLKGEYIESTGANYIKVSTTKSLYIIDFYNKFTLLTEIKNAHTLAAASKRQKYIKYN